MDWAGEQYEVDFLKKCWFGEGCFGKVCMPKSRLGWEIALLKKIQKSATCKMTLAEFKHTFRPILDFFLEFPADFLFREGEGLGGT